MPISKHKLLLDAFRIYGDSNHVKLLLAHGASFEEMPISKHELLLETFLYHENSNRMKLLLAHGASFDEMPTSKHELLLETFQKYENHDSVELLLAHGASFDEMPISKHELLQETFLYHGDSDHVKLLLKHGASFDEISLSKHALLLKGFQDGHGNSMKLLLAHGASFDEIPISKHDLLLKRFQEYGKHDSVELLLAHGASFDEMPISKHELLVKMLDESRFGFAEELEYYGASLLQTSCDPLQLLETCSGAQHKFLVIHFMRKVLDYEAQNCRTEAQQLAKVLFRFSHKDPSGVLKDLFKAIEQTLADTVRSIMDFVSRETQLSILVSRRLCSKYVRPLLGQYLRQQKEQVPTLSLKVCQMEISVPRDVLGFWSRYFKVAFSRPWSEEDDAFNFDKHDELSNRSVLKIFTHFVFTSEYSFRDQQDLHDDRITADYFQIERLQSMLANIGCKEESGSLNVYD